MRPWKNIISIGDSDAERLALQETILHYRKHGRREECHCKSLRLMHEPGLEDLTKELVDLRELLPEVAFHEGHVDLDITSTGVKSITSRDTFLAA